jgi:hypothetical protein
MRFSRLHYLSSPVMAKVPYSWGLRPFNYYKLFIKLFLQKDELLITGKKLIFRINNKEVIRHQSVKFCKINPDVKPFKTVLPDSTIDVDEIIGQHNIRIRI